MRASKGGGWTWVVPALLVCSACAGSGGSALPPGPSEPEEVEYAPALGVDLAVMERTASGLYLQDLREGDGIAAQRTSLVVVAYVGYLADGTIFDSTVGGEPYQFRLGGSEVIRGWNQGIPGMKRGGIRRLIVPPRLGYGSRARGRVPPNSTMIFDVQLLDVR